MSGTFIRNGVVCRPWSDADSARAEDMRLRGMGLAAIGRKLNRGRASVQARLNTLARVAEAREAAHEAQAAVIREAVRVAAARDEAVRREAEARFQAAAEDWIKVRHLTHDTTQRKELT